MKRVRQEFDERRRRHAVVKVGYHNRISGPVVAVWAKNKNKICCFMLNLACLFVMPNNAATVSLRLQLSFLTKLFIKHPYLLIEFRALYTRPRRFVVSLVFRLLHLLSSFLFYIRFLREASHAPCSSEAAGLSHVR